MPQQRNQKRIEPNMQTTVLRVETARRVDMLKKMAKWIRRIGIAQRYVASQMPVRRARASQVPATKMIAWKPTKASTPTYLPVNSAQRGAGLVKRTETVL